MNHMKEVAYVLTFRDPEGSSRGVISTFPWGGGIFLYFSMLPDYWKIRKKRHFICSNLTFIVPFFLSFFFPLFSFFFFLLSCFLFSFSLGGICIIYVCIMPTNVEHLRTLCVPPFVWGFFMVMTDGNLVQAVQLSCVRSQLWSFPQLNSESLNQHA